MSNLKFKGTFDTYEGALRFLGDKEERLVCYKTTARKVGANIHVRHHDTDILIFEPDGFIGLTNGGYPTPTTTQRLDTLTPACLKVYRSRRAIWLRLEDEGSIQIPASKYHWVRI